MKKALPLIVIAVFGAALVFLFMNFSKMAGKQSTVPLNFTLPEKWQEFTQVKDQTGQEALDAFQKEHQAKIAWKDGVKADYTDGKVKFSVWIAGVPSDGTANQMVLDMGKKIGMANPVFSAPKAIDLGAVKGYKLEGQGNVNYFYARGRQVYWIAVNGSPDPDALVKGIVTDLQKF